MGRKSIGLIFAAFIFMAFFSACITHIEKNRVNVGDTIPFGRHNWNVLDLDGDYALIISTRNVTTSTYNINWEPVTWETSGIREWLNLSFINSFNEAEQARIRETAVSNSNNPWFNTDGGN
ncbi:MAG: DUF6273 domain-containing protein, partial [Defluviitaleaceae bacterium]|nr:DUF6273 domain-containing protein [Defluviitaleaceae bacterium]